MLTSWMQAGITPALGAWAGNIDFTAETTTSTSAGRLYGYSRPGWYNAATPIGTIETDLFVDRRNPETPKTIRLMGIVNQTNAYMVIGWKDEPTIPPSPTMPNFHGYLKINGRTFNLSQGTRPGVQAGYGGLYWTTPGGPGIADGGSYSFEFTLTP